ncbi:MAG: hypothetical protein ACI4TD_07310 [Phocaeicola sp.]
MSDYVITRVDSDDELMHYGVLGMKWGVRRYRNSNGSLTKEGIEKYRPNRAIGNVGRALSNTSVGQRVIGVGTNKGYRQDKKEIKGKYKERKESYKQISDKESRKAQMKSLKNDYRKTLGEARENASSVLYPWQKATTNKKIQTSHLGKEFTKSMLMGGYGTLNYNRLSANDINKGTSAVAGVLSSVGDAALSGWLSIGDYAYNSINYSTKNKRK